MSCFGAGQFYIVSLGLGCELGDLKILKAIPVTSGYLKVIKALSFFFPLRLNRALAFSKRNELLPLST